MIENTGCGVEGSMLLTGGVDSRILVTDLADFRDMAVVEVVKAQLDSGEGVFR